MTPCVKCGGIARYKSSGSCVRCARESQRAYNSRRVISPEALARPCEKCGQADRLISTGRCRPCQNVAAAKYRRNNLEKIRARDAAHVRRYREADPEKFRDYKKQRAYKLAPGEAAAILAAQGGVCAICELVPKTPKQTHVDHCHVSGQVRGVLCHGCNAGLGMFRDDAERLTKAVSYLGKWAIRQPFMRRVA